MDDGPAGESNARTLADFLERYVGVVFSSEKVWGGARICDNTRTSFCDGLSNREWLVGCEATDTGFVKVAC